MNIIRLEQAVMSNGRFWRCIMSGKYASWSNTYFGAIGYGSTAQEAMLAAAQQQIKAHNISALNNL